MMASSVFAFLVLLLGVTFGLPLKSNEVEDFVFRANDLNRFSPYSDDDRTLLVERSVDPIGGGNLIRSLNMNDFDSNLVHGRQQVRRSAMPEGMNGDWNLGAERRNPYRYSWPRYGSIHSNFRRALDSIGGGHLIKRTLDSIGGANLIRNELANNPALLEYYLSILNSSSGRRSDGPSIEIIKKNFDEIDRTGFKHLKRNFDEIDRVGFSELKRSV